MRDGTVAWLLAMVVLATAEWPLTLNATAATTLDLAGVGPEGATTLVDAGPGQAVLVWVPAFDLGDAGWLEVVLRNGSGSEVWRDTIVGAGGDLSPPPSALARFALLRLSGGGGQGSVVVTAAGASSPEPLEAQELLCGADLVFAEEALSNCTDALGGKVAALRSCVDEACLQLLAHSSPDENCPNALQLQAEAGARDLEAAQGATDEAEARHQEAEACVPSLHLGEGGTVVVTWSQACARPEIEDLLANASVAEDNRSVLVTPQSTERSTAEPPGPSPFDEIAVPVLTLALGGGGSLLLACACGCVCGWGVRGHKEDLDPLPFLFDRISR
jgi:hypothetical protein